MMKKVLLLIGSPKPGKSTSESLGQYLLDKLQLENVQVETLKLKRSLEVESDIQQLVSAVNQCDIFVIAAPLYVDTPPAMVMKAMEILHAKRKGVKLPEQRMFVLCNCGFPEAEQNQTAIAVYKNFARMAGFVWAGSVSVSAGAMINAEPLTKLGGMVKKITSALDAAAKSLASGGKCGDINVKPSVPGWLYLFVGEVGWRIQAKKNGCRKQLKAKPYQRISQ